MEQGIDGAQAGLRILEKDEVEKGESDPAHGLPALRAEVEKFEDLAAIPEVIIDTADSIANIAGPDGLVQLINCALVRLSEHHGAYRRLTWLRQAVDESLDVAANQRRNT